MNTEPTERMTEAQLQKIEASTVEDHIVCSKHRTAAGHDAPEVLENGLIFMSCGYTGYVQVDPCRYLIFAIRNAYDEIDAIRSELDAMARQIAEVTENYEIMGRAWDISDGSYDRNLRRGECVCSGYRDIDNRKAPDPACPIHGEETA